MDSQRISIMNKKSFKALNLNERTNLTALSAEAGVVIDLANGSIISSTNEELNSIDEIIDTMIMSIRAYESGDGYGLIIRTKAVHSFWSPLTAKIEQSREIRFTIAEKALASLGFYNEEQFINRLDDRQSLGYLSVFSGSQVLIECNGYAVMPHLIKDTDNSKLESSVAKAKAAYSDSFNV